MIRFLFLYISIYFESDAFSPTLFRNLSNKKTNFFKLFGTEKAKLYYQNPKDVNFWIEDEEQEDSETHNETHDNRSKLKNLAYEGKCLVDMMRRMASLIHKEETDYNHNNESNRHSYDQLKQEYEIALQNAKYLDAKYGFCSEESLNAWDVVDDIRMKIKKSMINETDNSQMNYVLKACDLLEKSFMEIQTKIE